MRLVIFTLDAIFALIIAVASIAVLGFFFYLPQTSATLGYSSAASTFQSLLTSTIGSVASSNPIYSNLSYQFNATNEVWDQYQKDIYKSGSNQHGPLSPSVSFIFNAGATPTNISADYGKIYFGAANILYSVNGTNGNLVWKKSTPTTIVQGPAISSGMLIYPNSTNLTAVNPVTNALIWSSTGGALNNIISPLLVYNNKIYFGASSGGSAFDFAYYLNNGTKAWGYGVSTGAYALAVDAGSIVMTHSSGAFTLMNDFGSSGNVIWNKALTSFYGVSTVPYNNLIAFPSITGGVSSANGLYIDGNVAAGFPIGIVYQATQPAVYNNVVYYQTSNAVVALAANGLLLWTAAVPVAAGTALSRSSVVASAKEVYTEWSNNYVIAINSSTGNIAWSTNVPTQLGALSDIGMTLAYGRLYVVAGNNIIAYGACNSQPSGSILAAAASMYANNAGSCADALIDYYSPMTNYSIFLNNTFAPAQSIASFNGISTSIQNPTKSLLNGLQSFTITAWVNPTNVLNGPYIYSEGSPANTMTLQLLPSGNLYISTYNKNPNAWKSFSSTLNAPLNTWTFVAGVLTIGGNTGTFNLYANGQLQSSSGQAESNTVVSTYGIGYNVGVAAGQSGGYFTGNIANIQIYNSSLTSTQVSQIYQGGIQGAPLRNLGLQAWYPLAGDSNDYSGLGNTAYPINIIYPATNYLPRGYQNSFQVSKAGSILPILNYTTGVTRLNRVSVVAWR